MISIDISQIQSVETGPKYRSDTTVTASTGIAQELFVFQTADDEFTHVASVWDVDNIPATKATAISLGSDYYRENQVVRDFLGVEDATEFSNYARARLQLVVNEYDLVSAGFEGTELYTIDSGV